ncbi:MAG: hypothetical protein H0X45_00690, partial [Planctomycetes bacterium]|nr:hypothetical protein [Planctomycetota bacterium]
MTVRIPKPTATTCASVAGVLVALIGLLVLVGWAVGSPALVQILPQFVPMRVNTALGLLVAGLGLIAAARERRAHLAVAVAAVLAIALTTVVQYVVGFDYPWDGIAIAAAAPGPTATRMAANTALCFLLTGIALAAYAWRGAEAWRATAVAIAGGLVLAASFLAICGYVAALPHLYGWGHYTRMALHTAIGLALIGGGLIALAGVRGVERTSVRALRRRILALAVAGVTAAAMVGSTLGILPLSAELQRATRTRLAEHVAFKAHALA